MDRNLCLEMMMKVEVEPRFAYDSLAIETTRR